MIAEILNKLFDFILWIEPKIAVYSRNYRYTLGNRIENNLYDIMEHLIKARFSKKKVRLMYSVNTDIEKLVYYFRISHKLKLTTDRNYKYISQSLTDVSMLVNEFIKKEK